MLTKIAWRNVWRNKLRSFTVMGAVVVGVWALIFLLSFNSGFINAYVESAIENELSHLQVHHPDFRDEQEITYRLDKALEMQATLAAPKAVKAHTTRSISNGMLATAKGSRGVQIRGIAPSDEAEVTKLDQKLVDGKYFTDSKKSNPILISQRLANKLKLKLKSKVVLTFQQLDGTLTSAAFKVIGLYETGNAVFEDQMVFVEQGDLNRLLGASNTVHEVAVKLNDIEQLDTIKRQLAAQFPTTSVETYRELSPDDN